MLAVGEDACEAGKSLFDQGLKVPRYMKLTLRLAVHGCRFAGWPSLDSKNPDGHIPGP